MFNFVNKDTWDNVTFSPFLRKWTSWMISIVPLTILVAIFKDWKKFVCPGSKPVGPDGTQTSPGAIEPDLAAAGTLFFNTISRTADKLPFVNTNPILP